MICKVCGTRDSIVSKNLGVCYKCLINGNPKAINLVKNLRKKNRLKYNLPAEVPKQTDGISCNWCQNKCIVNKGTSYCGLVSNKNGKLSRFAGIKIGLASWYYDALPTNCVSDWVCPAGSNCGYPKYSVKKGPEYGYYNLAVFYGSCTFDCLFCQNSQYKKYLNSKNYLISTNELANKVHEKVSCICYFGGDPSSQVIHSILTSKIALKNAKKKNRILRICWETNGSSNNKIIAKMAELALESGGNIKVDLKCFTEQLNISLCGVSNKQTLQNFEFLNTFIEKRPDVPFLIASTLLIPGYIDIQEIDLISKFIVNLNPEIPYRLLGFFPHYLMSDLPRTSLEHAKRCLNIAKRNGLKNVSIGNTGLLSNEKYTIPN
ncbi:MAG: radical SAM protein [Candidatus Helarchaeota archaeon]